MKNPQITQISLLYSPSNVFFAHRLLPCGICFFLDMKTREHDLFSRSFFSPTNYTNFTPLFSLKRLFSPRNARNSRNFIIYFPQITQIKMIFTIRIQRFALLLRKNRSTDLHRFLPYAFFFRHEDMRIWFFITEFTFYCVNGNRGMWLCGLLYSIFILYL